MRNMILLLTLQLLLTLAPNGSSLLARDSSDEEFSEEIKKEFPFEPAGRLTIENAVGEIEVTGWDEPRVEIFAVKKVRSQENPDKARELLKKIEIQIKQTGNEIKIEASFPACLDLSDGISFSSLFKLAHLSKNNMSAHVNFRIRLPRRTDLKIDQSVGELEVDSIDADLKAENSVGEISLTNIRGEIIVENSVGNISLSHITGPADISCGVGEINLRLPSDAAVDLMASSGMGEINCDLPLSVKGKFISKSLQGKVNGGGPRIKMETSLGEINIMKE